MFAEFKDKALKAKAKAAADLDRLALSMAQGENVLAAIVEKTLAAAGVTMEELELLFNVKKERLAAAKVIADAGDAEKRLVKLEAEALKLQQERDAATAKIDAKLNPMRGEIARLRGVVSEASFARTTLARTFGDAPTLERERELRTDLSGLTRRRAELRERAVKGQYRAERTKTHDGDNAWREDGTVSKEAVATMKREAAEAKEKAAELDKQIAKIEKELAEIEARKLAP